MKWIFNAHPPPSSIFICGSPLASLRRIQRPDPLLRHSYHGQPIRVNATQYHTYPLRLGVKRRKIEGADSGKLSQHSIFPHCRPFSMAFLYSPPLISPTETHTPPLAAIKRLHSEGINGHGARSESEPVDAVALSAALKDFDNARTKERTPTASPSRKRQRVYGDRFIPNREGQDIQASFNLLYDDGSPATLSRAKRRTPHGELHFQKSEYLPRVCGSGVYTDE